MRGSRRFSSGSEGRRAAVRPYEIVIIFDAGLDESAVRQVIDHATETIRSGGGNPGRVDHWGKRRFAYNLAGRWEGYYVILEVTAPPAAVAEVSRILSLADEVIRHKVVRIPEGVAGRERPTPPVEIDTEPVAEESASPAPSVPPIEAEASSVASSD